MRIRLLAGLLFCSGAGALVLEVAWFRRLGQVAGATSVALGAVLAAVIGGMALGAFAFGGRAQRSKNPLRLYAGLEVVVAVFAILSPWLLSASQPLFDSLTRSLRDSPLMLTATRFGLASLILAPPAICMGGTLPAMAAAMKRTARVGDAIGKLYAFNTFGAVLGTLTAGFVLLPTVGLANTMRIAALFSGTAALIAFRLRADNASASEDPPAEHEHPVADRRKAIRLYALSGLLGMAAEGAFVRGLVLIFGSTTYAFTIMLAVFLFGIALGGVLGGRLTGKHSLRRLGITVGCTAALFGAAALSIYMLPRLYLYGYIAWGNGFGADIALRIVLSAVVLLPGAICLGIAFPLAADVAASKDRAYGTGRLYAANAVASVTGSTLAVFVLVPSLGPVHAIGAVGVVVAILALLETRNPAQLLLLPFAATAFFPVSDVARERLFSGIYLQPRSYISNGTIDEYKWHAGKDVAFYKYGNEATVSIERWYGAASIYVNGKTVASGQDMIEHQHLASLGHFPMALHPKPDKVLVIGLGMGTTYKAIKMHAPKEVTVVEIEPAIGDAAAYLGVKPDHLVFDDGRAFMRATTEKYDIVSSDTIHPWVRGGGDLYSLEYFQTCRDVMAEGAIICHWLPLYQMAYEDVRSVVRTFAEVFHTHAFFSGTNISLIGTVKPVPLVPQPPATPQARIAMDNLGMAHLMDLVVFGPEGVEAAAGDATILRDDSLQLEFSTPRHLRSPEKPRILEWMGKHWRDPAPPYGALMNAIIAKSKHDTPAYQQALVTAAQEAPNNGFVRRYQGEAYMEYARRMIPVGKLDQAEKYLNYAKTYLGADTRLLGISAELEGAKGNIDKAIAYLQRLLDKFPDSTYIERLIGEYRAMKSAK